MNSDEAHQQECDMNEDKELPPPRNLFQRILAIQAAVGEIAKDADVDGKYKAVTHDAVTREIRWLMTEHGVVSFPTLVSSENIDTGTKWGKRQLYQYHGKYEITYFNADNPKERYTITMEGYADDSGDKGPGKALSYATKSADLKVFKIPTGEDDEERIDEGKIADPVLRDNESLALDIRAKAGELFGDDHANEKLESLAKRVFQIKDGEWLNIPIKHKAVVLKKLDAQADRERGEKDASGRGDVPGDHDPSGNSDIDGPRDSDA